VSSSTSPATSPSGTSSPLEARVIDIERLYANAWNPNRQDTFMYEKELASIRTFGFVSPIIAREVGSEFEIVDGEHRWKAAKQLGYRSLPVWSLGIIPDATAKQLTIVLNETKGHADPLALRELLTDLMTVESLSMDDLLEVMPFPPERFEGLLAMPDVDLSGMADPVSPSSGEKFVERIYRLPRDAAAVIDDAIERARGDSDIADWRALELIAADFLGGFDG
jgi:ParB-like chromosome segregation protein Spo0J